MNKWNSIECNTDKHIQHRTDAEYDYGYGNHVFSLFYDFMHLLSTFIILITMEMYVASI